MVQVPFKVCWLLIICTKLQYDEIARTVQRKNFAGADATEEPGHGSLVRQKLNAVTARQPSRSDVLRIVLHKINLLFE